MGKSLEAVSSALGLVYDTAHEQGDWREALQAIMGVVGATSASYRPLLMPGGRSEGGCLIEASSDFVKAFSTPSAQQGPLNRVSFTKGNAGRAFSIDQFLTDAEYFRSDHYNEFFKPHGFSRALVGIVSQSEGAAGVIMCRRPLGAEPFSADDRRVMELFIPHIQRAAEFSSAVGSVKSLSDDLLTMLDGLARGVVLLKSNDMILHLNREAGRILATADGLRSHHQRLCTVDTSLESALRVLTARRAELESPIGPLLVPRERSDSPLIVTSMPASQGRMRSEFASVTSIVVITDPDHSPESIDKVASAFGVTTAEAAVALGLVQGDDAATIARKRGVSLNTVRTLRSRAYQKIGVRSQGALVKILGALS